MMNHKKNNNVFSTHLLGIAGLTLVGASAFNMVGCEEEPPPPPPVVQKAPVAPPPPPAPKVVSLDDLRAEMNIDSRIFFEEANAPRDTEQRRAVLSFFDGFARGNSSAVKQMMPPLEQLELANLIETGRWQQNVDGINQIEVVTGPAPNLIGVDTGSNSLAVLGIFQVNGDYQPTMWYLSDGVNGPEFIAAPTPPEILSRISGADMIAAWHDVIKAEMARADEADLEVPTKQQILAQRESVEGGPAAPSGPDSPAPPSIPSPGGPSGPSPSIPGID